MARRNKTPEIIAARRAEGQRAWDLIRASGVKRRFVASFIGVSYGYMNQITYGHAALTAGVKKKLADYLGVPVDELFPNGGQTV